MAKVEPPKAIAINADPAFIPLQITVASVGGNSERGLLLLRLAIPTFVLSGVGIRAANSASADKNEE